LATRSTNLDSTTLKDSLKSLTLLGFALQSFFPSG
jgi:hypothetical protein